MTQAILQIETPTVEQQATKVKEKSKAAAAKQAKQEQAQRKQLALFDAFKTGLIPATVEFCCKHAKNAPDGYREQVESDLDRITGASFEKMLKENNGAFGNYLNCYVLVCE